MRTQAWFAVLLLWLLSWPAGAEEPVTGASHPLLGMKNALCTPHLGYAERGSYEALYANAVEQLLAYAAGAPINVANPDAIGKR